MEIKGFENNTDKKKSKSKYRQAQGNDNRLKREQITIKIKTVDPFCRNENAQNKKERCRINVKVFKRLNNRFMRKNRLKKYKYIVYKTIF